MRFGHQLKHAAMPCCHADLLTANLDSMLRRKAEDLASPERQSRAMHFRSAAESESSSRLDNSLRHI